MDKKDIDYKDKISEKLNDLLNKTTNTEKKLRIASEKVKDSGLKALFEELVQQTYNYKLAITAEIREYKEIPDQGSSAKGKVTMAWMDLKASLSSDKKETVLNSLEEGLEAAVKNYDEILQDQDFPTSTVNLLSKQRDGLRNSLKKISALKDSY